MVAPPRNQAPVGMILPCLLRVINEQETGPERQPHRQARKGQWRTVRQTRGQGLKRGSHPSLEGKKAAAKSRPPHLSIQAQPVKRQAIRGIMRAQGFKWSL